MEYLIGETFQSLDHSPIREFPNGFSSWIETYAEICFQMGKILGDESEETDVYDKLWQRYDVEGRGGMYKLAEELTEEFELLNLNRQWDGEFFDEIDSFIQNKLV